MRNGLVWALAAALILAVAEFLYILSLKGSIRRIAQDFAEKLSEHTNTLLSVTMPDPEIRRLAQRINRELQTLRRERLRLQQGDRELKNAVTGIAHDLRTPLAAISGYLELLEEVPVDGRTRRYLAVIGERTNALKRLTEELLQYSVITSASGELKPTMLSLKSELEIALTGAYGMLSEKGITPDIHLPDGEVRRLLDRTAVQRVFGNILTNTAKYSDGDLTVSLTEDGQIVFRNWSNSLSRVEADRLFDRFYTVENAKGSIGLGLSIARELTQWLNGSIRAEWKAGSLFVVLRFPAGGE